MTLGIVVSDKKLLYQRFLKKQRGYCNSLCPPICSFVCPLCCLLLNHWTKFNQILCVSYSHEWGVQRFFLAHSPGALGKGQKVKYHLIQITKSNSKFLYQTVCLFSQMKDTKHIRRDFNSVAWVMPQWSDFWALGVPRCSFSNMVMWHIKSTG